METGQITIDPVSSKAGALLPTTGENAAIFGVVFVLFVSLTLVSVFVIKKGGKKNEHE